MNLKYLSKIKAWFFKQRIIHQTSRFVMTTYRDRVIIADNYTGDIWSLVQTDCNLQWKFQKIGRIN